MLQPAVGRAIYEADIHRPNDRHDGIALAPLPNHPNTTRNLSMPRPRDDDATVNVHPILVSPTQMHIPRGSKHLDAIDHSNFRVSPCATSAQNEDGPVGAAAHKNSRFRTLEPLQKQ
jgi:hypothetical protein